MYFYSQHVCLVSQRSEEDDRCPGTGFADGCEPPSNQSSAHKPVSPGSGCVFDWVPYIAIAELSHSCYHALLIDGDLVHERHQLASNFIFVQTSQCVLTQSETSLGVMILGGTIMYGIYLYKVCKYLWVCVQCFIKYVIYKYFITFSSCLLTLPFVSFNI